MKMHNLHILWDWNGTLVNDMDLCVYVTNLFMKKHHNKKITHETYKQKFTFPVIDFYHAIGFDFKDISFTQMAEEWISTYKQHFHSKSALNGEVLETLNFVKNQGLKQSIFSACEVNLLQHSINHLELNDYFHKVHGVDNNEANGKESLAVKIIEDNHIDPDETILFGDTIHDYEVAKSTGISCVLIANGHQCSKRLQKTGAPVLEHIGEVPAYLKSLQ